MCAPRSRTSSGSSVLTVAFVPTGMNAGVGTSPCAVRTTPARAAPSVASSSNVSLIDRHVAPVDEEVAAMLEAEPFVVLANARVVADAVEPEEVASCTGAAHGELVDVRRVGRTLGPVRRVVPEQRHGRDDITVKLRDVHLAAVDCRCDLLARIRKRPLFIAAFAYPHGRLVQQGAHFGHVTRLAPAHVHRTSMASPKE